ncbi:hypothetical protein PsorP6_013525 [Peronosclerospora sorghi]|uniref:Uncharacterized protein n=1 Tax=Peronosclerospora sorghi TaxID=230839 RepID=A0ACC0VHG4_9STRA|nr:hypothetical protein PsorP6_013525 [Peronosclerospora sorghi]
MNTINELFQRAQEQQHGPPPTSKPFLDKVPVKVWTQEMEKMENQRECVIFLSEYEKDDTIISLPSGHTIHKGCGLRWLLEHNVCPTCRYQLPIKTEVSTSQSEQPTTSGTIAGTEPEQVPSMPDTTLSVTGVRHQRPTETFRPREVRQRVNEPAPVDDVVDLDFMLEQEADRFMKEEIANRKLAKMLQHVTCNNLLYKLKTNGMHDKQVYITTDKESRFLLGLVLDTKNTSTYFVLDAKVKSSERFDRILVRNGLEVLV